MKEKTEKKIIFITAIFGMIGGAFGFLCLPFIGNWAFIGLVIWALAMIIIFSFLFRIMLF